jgi:hypothetical protein
MDTLNTDYNSLSPEDKKVWVKAEIERKRKQFRGENSKTLPVDVAKEFASLAHQLSPENLHEDGEISDAQAQKKYITIMRKWHKLETQVGRKVTENEIYGI